jgi:hypothetical protein
VIETEAYTHAELDEVAGSLLFHGGIQGALSHLLDMTRDANDLELVEFINHAPTGMALPILAATKVAVGEAMHRLLSIARATESALDGVRARLAEQDTEQFENIVRAEFGDDAKRNGLD